MNSLEFPNLPQKSSGISEIEKQKLLSMIQSPEEGGIELNVWKHISFVGTVLETQGTRYLVNIVSYINHGKIELVKVDDIENPLVTYDDRERINLTFEQFNQAILDGKFQSVEFPR